MRILHLIDSVVGGGAERSLAALLPEWHARGVAVDVAYLRDRPGLQDELRAGGAELFCLDGSAGRLGWIRRAARLVAERRPDLVHTTLFEAHTAGRIAGAMVRVPVVSTLTGLLYGPEHRSAPGLVPWKVRAAQAVDVATARLVTRFHAVAGHVADTMSRRLRVPRDRIEVVPRGRDPAALGAREPGRRREARDALGVGPEEALVLAIGRHDRKKGLDVLVDAFHLVRRGRPRARLVVAGPEGNLTRSLEDAAMSLGPDGVVRFLGAREDVPDLLCAADAFVLPSRSEGFPGVLLEAMALEAPIVASDLPAVREALGAGGGVGWGECAVLVPPADAGALAGAILEAIGDPAAAAERARRARARFLSHWTIDRVAERMLELYERALADGRRRRPGPGGGS